jgi:hypothetical protein
MSVESSVAVSSTTELENVIGNNVNFKAALCQSCITISLNLLCSQHPTFPWAVNLECLNCLKRWSICKVCPGHRTQLSKPFMLNKHNTRRHKRFNTNEVNGSDDPPLPVLDVEMDSVNLCHPSAPDINGDEHTLELIIDSPHEFTVASVCCGNDRSNSYFHYDKIALGGGSTYLITRAITETPVFLSEVLHPRDICYHMKVADSY